MGRRYTREQLDRFTVAMVLEHFGLPTQRRGPCPLCKTSDTSQAFCHGGSLFGFYCHACGRKGDAVTLYAELSGVRPGRAIAEIASHLGLIESTPSDWDARKAAREREAADKQEAADIERARWLGRVARSENLRREIATVSAMGCTPLTWSVLGNLYLALERVETWLDTREYDAKGWTQAC